MTVKNKLVYIYFLFFLSCFIFLFCFLNSFELFWLQLAPLFFYCFSIIILVVVVAQKIAHTTHLSHTLETSWRNRSVILIWNLFFCFFLYLFFSCCKLVDSTSYKYYLRTFVRQYSKLEMNWRGENHMRILRSENASRRRRHRPQWEARKQENVRENAFVCILLFFFNFFINN